MSEPIQKSFSKEQLFEIAKHWINDQYRNADGTFNQVQTDKRHQELGLLVSFIHDLFGK